MHLILNANIREKKKKKKKEEDAVFAVTDMDLAKIMPSLTKTWLRRISTNKFLKKRLLSETLVILT
ncbi:hypothetical protein EF87_16330 [Bacillus amyloliquefaciens]|nr:hypothetical protein EF87_16330 [Bacillus amyloliquefaciens]